MIQGSELACSLGTGQTELACSLGSGQLEGGQGGERETFPLQV